MKHKNYIIIGVILIGAFVGYYIVYPQYVVYKKWRNDLNIWQNNVSNQIIFNTQNIKAIVDFINNSIEQNKK